MEGDVVLADEAIAARFRFVPPGFPGFGLLCVVGPFHRGGEISHYGFEPHIKTLLVPTIKRHRDAPIDVARHGASFQAAFDIVASEVDHVGAPVIGMFFHVGQQAFAEGGQIEVEVFCLAYDGCTAIGFTSGIDQLQCVQQVATVVTLIAARLFVPADRTGAFHITIGKETVFAFGEQLRLGLAIEIFFLMQTIEDILGDAVVILGVRMRKQVIADTDRLLSLEKALVILFE